MRSLTGFGIGEAPLARGRILAEVRSVNHRFLEVRARLPRELADLALFAEQTVRERLRRGRVELVVHTEGAVLGPVAIDQERARAAFRALAAVRDELAPGTELPLSLLAAVPDLFGPPTTHELDAAREALRVAALAAVDAMDAMRVREGRALSIDSAARAATLRAITIDVSNRIEASAQTTRAKLRERLERLLGDPQSRAARASLDPARLEAEVAILAEKSDVAEELTRLGSHLAHWDAIVAEAEEHEPPSVSSGPSAQPVGRRLDFLLQEMVRETNTLGAKAQDADVSQRVVAMKAELERLREQVQNVE